MEEITILYDMPIILTKDKQFIKNLAESVKYPGSVVLLPGDAILVSRPIKIEIKEPALSHVEI